MAKILYEVKQNQNSHNAAYGKWYAKIRNLETLNTRKLANHISEHGSIYTPDVVYGVLEKFRSCLLEMLLDSKKVKIEGLGTFYCTLENTKSGALKKEDFNVNKHLKALHIRFLPEQTTEENISSREFLKKAEFINIDSLLPKEDDENGHAENNSGGNGHAENTENTENGDEPLTAPQITGQTPFAETTQVSIQGPQGAEIRYTTDGSNPTAESTLYSEAFTLSATATVKAIAIMNGESSQVSSKIFTKASSGDDDDYDTGS